MERDTAFMLTRPIAQPTTIVGPTGGVSRPMPRRPRITRFPNRQGICRFDA
ncbi:MAG: hypothetical protein ACJ8F2_26390 [Xanthobacteraceae bacterium]